MVQRFCPGESQSVSTKNSLLCLRGLILFRAEGGRCHVKSAVENKGDFCLKQLSGDSAHDTNSNKQNGRAARYLIEKTKEGDSQEKCSWDYSQPWVSGILLHKH